MVKPANKVDKDRFEKMKETELDRGRDEEKATEAAANETKELRRREGRAKDNGEAAPDAPVENPT